MGEKNFRCPMCMLLERENEELKTLIPELTSRLKKARDIFRRIKPAAESEIIMEEAVVEAYKMLKRMNITVGADVGEQRKLATEAKNILFGALKSTNKTKLVL